MVCGLLETIATFEPTKAFTSVDLPAFGRPSTVTKPETCFGFLDLEDLGLLAFTIVGFYGGGAREAHLRDTAVVRG